MQQLECLGQYLRLVILDFEKEFHIVSTYGLQNFVEFKSSCINIKFFPGTNVKYQISIDNEFGQEMWVLEVRYRLNDVSRRELIFPGSQYIYPKNDNGNFEVGELRSREIFVLLKKLEELLNRR